jgi:excisionase family DNA binding protein
MADYTPRYPLLEALLAQLNFAMKGRYTLKDAAQILGVSVRTVQDRIRDGKLRARNLLPYRFLSEDLEDYLRCSVIKRNVEVD